MTLVNLISAYHEQAKEEGGATDQGLADYLTANGAGRHDSFVWSISAAIEVGLVQFASQDREAGE